MEELWLPIGLGQDGEGGDSGHWSLLGHMTRVPDLRYPPPPSPVSWAIPALLLAGGLELLGQGMGLWYLTRGRPAAGSSQPAGDGLQEATQCHQL